MYHPKNKYIALVTLLLMVPLLISSLGSCTPRMSALLPAGQIIEADQDRILVIFQDVSGKPYTYGYSWFYYPYADTLKGDYEVKVVVIKKEEE